MLAFPSTPLPRHWGISIMHLVLSIGDIVMLINEPDCIVPPGAYRVSKVNQDGSFHVGGNTAIWPTRIKEIKREQR